MVERAFQPGFRLSAFDVAILVAGGVATAYFGAIDAWFGVAVAFVVLHFFLFCNVFRISRVFELIWAAVFTALAAGAITSGAPSWPLVFIASAIVTAIVVAVEMRRPSYHGIGWRRLNPRLPEWWETKIAGEET